jgi:uncharacterized membrane protein (DUF485 family)
MSATNLPRRDTLAVAANKQALDRFMQHDRQYFSWAVGGFVVALCVLVALIPVTSVVSETLALNVTKNGNWLAALLALIGAVMSWFVVIWGYRKRYDNLLHQAMAEEVTQNSASYDDLYTRIRSRLDQQS